MEKKGDLEVNVSLLEEKQAAVVVLVGELDHFTLSKVENIVMPLFEKKQNVIVDCEGLRYISSTGLLALLRYYSRAKGKGKKFFVVSPNRYLNDLLGAAGSHRLLMIYETLTEAEEAL